MFDDLSHVRKVVLSCLRGPLVNLMYFCEDWHCIQIAILKVETYVPCRRQVWHGFR